jgi:acetolactate synthase-1/2/3 large subunit
MDKFDGRGIAIATRIHARLDQFFAMAADRPGYTPPALAGWLQQIEAWRAILPDDRPPIPPDTAGHVDAINVVDVLSDALAEDEIILVDTGGNLTWTCNTIRTKTRQRLISAWNFTPMGYALPAVLGAAAACPGRPIACIIGDGGLQLCLHELSTILRYRIPVKIFLFNNHAHGIQKQTLETWLGAHYVGVDEPSGLAFCDFPRVAEALGFPVVTVARSSELTDAIARVCAASGPIFCNVEIDHDQRLLPFLKYGGALDQQTPPLDPELLRSAAITMQE